MTGGVNDHDRVLCRDAVKIFFRRMPFLGEHRIVITIAEDRDAARNLLLMDEAAHLDDDVVNALDVVDRRRAERRVSPQRAVIADVRMAVDEAGDHRTSLKVYDFG